jgi:hypothetical protein
LSAPSTRGLFSATSPLRSVVLSSRITLRKEVDDRESYGDKEGDELLAGLTRKEGPIRRGLDRNGQEMAVYFKRLI